MNEKGARGPLFAVWCSGSHLEAVYQGQQLAVGPQQGGGALLRVAAVLHQEVQHVANAHHVAVDLLGHPALLLGSGGDLAAEIVDLHHGVGHGVEAAGDMPRGVGRRLAAALGLLHGDHGLGDPLGEP